MRLMLMLPLVAGMALAGCAGTGKGGSTQGLSSSEQQLRDRTSRFNETMLTGGLAGAAIGAVGGCLIDRHHCGRGAAVGGVAGGAVGAAAGYYIATRNESFTNREEAAQARIAAARREADDLQQTAAVADRVTQENRNRLAELDRRYRAGQITAAQYSAEAAPMREDLDHIRKAENAAGQARSQMAADAASQANLRREASRVGDAEQRLRSAAGKLDEALRRVPAG
jgi:gas vesicle protein